MEQAVFRFGGAGALFVRRLGRGNLRQPHLSICSSYCSRLTPQPAEMVEHLVARYRAKPAAECVTAPLLSEAGNVCRHGLKDFLEHIGSILVLEVPAAAPMKDKWAIKGDQS